MKQRAQIVRDIGSETNRANSTSQWIDFGESIEIALKEQRGRFMVLAVPFVLAPLVAMCIGVLAYSNLNRQYSQELAASQEKQRKLDELTTENGKIREGVMEMLNDHLPGLMTFKFDQSVDMNNKYLKALAF